jgi:hypothetical protein
MSPRDVKAADYSARRSELLTRKRHLRNFIEREGRQYPSARTRHEHRQRARELHGWHALLAEIKAHTEAAL